MKRALVLFVLLMASCDSDKGEPGSEGNACYGNGTCNPGLVCASKICVSLPKADSGSDIQAVDLKLSDLNLPDMARDVSLADLPPDSSMPDAKGEGVAADLALPDTSPDLAVPDTQLPDSASCAMLHFSGQDKVVVPNSPAFDFGYSLSALAWIRLDYLPTTHEMSIFTNEYSGHYCAALELAVDTAGHLWLDANGDEGATNCSPKLNVKSLGVVPTQQWVHVAAVYDIDEVRLYIDGQLDTAFSVSPVDPYLPSHDLWIGLEEGPHPGLVGNIRDLQVWGRALSGSEVGEARSDTMTNFSGLLGRWRLDEGTGGIAYDSSSFGRHGLIQGPTWTVLQQACP